VHNLNGISIASSGVLASGLTKDADVKLHIRPI